MSKEKTIWERLNLIQNPADLYKYVGKMVYILLYSENMVGTTKIVDLNTYLLDQNVLETYLEDPHDITLLYGVVLNITSLPTKLPSDLPKDHGLHIIRQNQYTSMEHEEVNDLDSVVEYVEYAMEDDDNTDIMDIAVLYAKEMEFVLQANSGGSEITHIHRKAMGVVG